MISEKHSEINAFDELLLAVLERQDVSYLMSIINKKEIKKTLKSEAGISIFEKATNLGLTKIASLLLSHGVPLKPHSPELKVNSYLHVAILCTDVDFASQLISLGANIEAVDSIGNSPLLLAIYMDNCQLAELLLNNGAHPSYWAQKRIFQQSPLGLAVERNNLEIVKLLLNCGTGIDCRELQHALYKAIYNCCDQIVQYLVSQGVQLYSSMTEDTTLLHIVAEFGCVGTVKYILNQKLFHVTSIDSKGRTPLHSVSINCNDIIPTSGDTDCILETVNVLLTHGSVIDLVDTMGMTSLMYSVKYHNHSVSQTLIEHGASVTNMQGSDSLLLLALEPSQLCFNCEIVDIILKHGGDEIIDHMNDNGFTALMQSIAMNNQDYTITLLKYFPCIEKVCSDGVKCYEKLILQFQNNVHVINQMQQYFGLMKTANLPISSSCRRAFSAIFPNNSRYKHSGEIEINEMKSNNLVDSLTVYEFLNKCLIDLIAYDQLFNSDITKSFKQYPVHKNILRKKFFSLKSKRVRQDLVQNASNCFLCIFGSPLPLLVVENICNYLKNSELEIFASAFISN